VLALASSLPTTAAEPFWASPSAAQVAGGRWRLSLEGESVGDRVEHSPNAVGGGFEPVTKRSRYAGGRLTLDWRASPEWHLSGSVGRRSITFLRDSYTVDGYHIGLARRLPSPSERTALALVLDVDARRADELYKNSWTEIGGVRLTGASLFDAADETVMLSVNARTRVRPTTHVTTLIGVGRTRATHARLSGVGTDGKGCRYGFEATASAGEIELLEPCRNVVAFHEAYTSEAGIERRLGFSPGADLAYTGRVLQGGVALEHVAGRLGLSLGYVYRRHDRGAFDERIRARGGTAVEASHTSSFRLGFAASRTVELGLGAHYRSTSYLDELPLLYNAFTNDRFAKNVLSFSGSLTLSF